MKPKSKIFLISVGLALSFGAISSSVFVSNKNTLKTDAANQLDFGKEICEIVISSSGFTASPDVLVNNQIVNSSYVYNITMAPGTSSSAHFPAVNYKLDVECEPVFDIILNNVKIQSVQWSTSCEYHNEHKDKQVQINWYCEGSNHIKGHNWNAVKFRDEGSGKLVLSTLTSGDLTVQDSYNNCCGFDERGYLEVAVDSNINVTQAKNSTGTYTGRITDTEMTNFLRSGLTPGNKMFNLNMTRSNDVFKKPVVGIWTSNTCSDLGSHNFNDVSYAWSEDQSSCDAEAICPKCNIKRHEKSYAIFNDSHANSVACFRTFPHVNQSLEIVEHSTSSIIRYDENYHWETCEYEECVSEINKVPHDYRSPVFSWSDDNSTCSVSKICATCGYEQNLTVETTNQITRQATCSIPGEITYTADFGDGLVTTKVVNNGVDPYAHDMSGVDITWSDDYSKCTVKIYCVNPGCSECFVDEGSVELVEYREATCNSDGIKVYKATFESGLIDQIKEIVLPATGEHNLDYENVTYVWNNDCTSCVAKIPCKNSEANDDQHFVEVEATITYGITTQPTCVEQGIGSIIASFDDPNLQTQYIPSGNVPALGHDYGEPMYKWNEDYTECTAKIICKRDKSHVLTEVATTSNESVVVSVIENPTCTNKGQKTVTAYFENAEFTTQTITLDINAKGHTPEIDGDGKEIYYSDDTYHWQHCTDCGSQDINKKTHNMVIQSMVNNDTEYHVVKKCSTCGKTSEEYIDKTGGVQDVAKGLISTTADSGVEAETLNNAIDNLAQDQSSAEQLNTIVDTIASSMGAVNEMQEALSQASTEEEKAEIQAKIEEAVEIVSIVAESSVVIASDAKENAAVAEELNNDIPQNVDLDMSEVFDDFYSKVMNELLGTSSTPVRSRGPIKRDEVKTNQIDFNIGADVYKNAMDFANTSVKNMSDAVGKLRECSGERITAEIKNYVETIKVSSFRDFNKAAADEAFFNNAYQAVLLELQQRVTATLDQEYNEMKQEVKGTQLQELTDKYNEERTAVQDIEEFEIMIDEIMRQKYVTIINDRYDEGMLDNEEYNVAISLASDVDTFADVYKEIFRAWCLQTPCDYNITLEELTDATIKNTTLRRFPPKEYNGGISASETIIFSCFAVVVIGGLVFAKVYQSKKEKGAK